MTNKPPGLTREAETDEAGRYSILSVLPRLRREGVRFGFRISTAPGRGITINSVTRVDLKLGIGQMTETGHRFSTPVTLQPTNPTSS